MQDSHAVSQTVQYLSFRDLILVVCNTNDDPFSFARFSDRFRLPDYQPIQILTMWFSPHNISISGSLRLLSKSLCPHSMAHFMPQKSRRCKYQRWYQICFITLTMFFEDTTRSRNFSYGLKVGPAFGPEQSIYQLRQEWIHHTYYFRNTPRHESFLAKSTHCQDTIRREKISFCVTLGWIFSREFISHLCISFHPSHQRCYDWKCSVRIGEASNPGPTALSATCQHLSLSLINPTTIYRKEDDFLALDTDILCLAETAATKTVQMAFNQALRPTPYQVFWSAPVPDKVAKVDPAFGHSLRGDNLGTAIMTRLSSRDTRHTFPSSTWETCRLNSVIISTGILDFLVVSAYFQTGKSAEARIVNNQLLHDIWLHVTTTTLPFIVAGDFNTDVRKLDAFSLFQQSGCSEMFEFHRNVFGFELPPTCKGATRYDSMIYHPFLQKYILRIDVGPEHQFADHCVVRVLFNVPTRHIDTFTWYTPKSWTIFPINHSEFDKQYSQYHRFVSDTQEGDSARALYKWSSNVESAIDRTLRWQKQANPLQYPQGFLPKLFRGRCATPRLVRTTCPKSPKRDSMGYYDPPTEVTSLKSRHKVRQVRRLKCLERLYQKHNLTSSNVPCGESSPQLRDMTILWHTIRKAHGYGRSWDRWLLQFEIVAAVPVELPTYDFVYSVRQITQYDADLYSQQEAKLQRQSQKHGLDLDVQYKSSSHYYKKLKAQEVKILPGFPVQLQTTATVRRGSKGPLQLIIHKPVTLRLFAAARFGTATLRVLDQQDHHVTCQVLEGHVPTHDDLIQDIYAFELPEMATSFQTYWSQFWNRDSDSDEHSDDSWQELLQTLRNRIPPTAPLTIQWNDPHLLSQTIQRLKPFKAVGIDGWRAEELQMLPPAAIQDFARILESIWPTGLSAHQLIARVILLAKRVPPTSISDGRPITILGYISRLTSKLIADQLLHQWTHTWPSAISGGLPFRSVQDITFIQQYQIESAKHRSLPWRGFTLDLIKAFNLLPRRVLYHLLIYHGAPPQAIRFWFTNLSRMTRRLQIRQQVGPPITMTTGVPEGDSMSVCAMLVVSSAFYWTLQSPTVFPYAYADNWSYLTTTQRDNLHALRQLQRLVEDLRMQIDYTKSWAWGATKEARLEWQTLLEEEFPDDNPVCILNSTKDLGCMTHYTRHITLGHLKTKINSAVQRCRRLRWFQTTITQKAQFIQTAIWPHAFFGAETQIVGEKHFRTLRREATIALIGPEKQISSWLAVHLFSSQLQDPLLYVIATGLSFIRRLYHTNPQLAQEFVQSIVCHNGPPIGPAGAMARYLQLVGWSLATDGSLTLDGYLSVSLRHETLRSIRHMIRRSWAYYLNRQICHRKGVSVDPFDYTILSRALRSMSPTAIRQVAYNLTGGYQVGAVKAQWTSTVDIKCPHCGQPDTHTHQQLDCPKFHAIRQRHPQAVSYLTRNPQKLWLPLPHTFPDITILRQLLAHRGADTGHTPIRLHDDTLYFYTDGSADTPTHPETRRAAWSLIQFCPDPSSTPYITIKIQHVQGQQTIARAELAAITWITQHVRQQSWPHKITITTDSQYAINAVGQVSQPNPSLQWHRLANADLLQTLVTCWDPERFSLRKVRSHQDPQTLPPGPARDDVIGNSWADHAAVRARHTDHVQIDTLFQRADLWHQDQLRQTQCILTYLADLNLCHAQEKQQSKLQTYTDLSHDTSLDWGALYRSRAVYTIHAAVHFFRPHIHPAFVTACVWGNQYADLVLQFCAALRWPDPDLDHSDPIVTSGITWLELTIAFVINTGLQFPTWLCLDDHKRSQPLHWQDPRVLALPTIKRSLREQAEAFRTIVLYLQGYSDTPLLPKFTKTGSISLTQIGWGRSFTGGMPLRPEIPNSDLVQRTISRYVEDLQCKPPFHPDGLIPMRHASPIFAVPPATELTFHQRFLYRRKLREAWHRGGDLDGVSVPPAPN